MKNVLRQTIIIRAIVYYADRIIYNITLLEKKKVYLTGGFSCNLANDALYGSDIIPLYFLSTFIAVGKYFTDTFKCLSKVTSCRLTKIENEADYSTRFSTI